MKLINNTYKIQNIDIKKIAKKFGTPLYIYDAESIKEHLEKFKRGFSTVDLKIKFACKSLTNINILRLMKAYGTGLDTVSIPEVKMGLMAGFEPTEIMFTPNCVDFSEIIEAVDLGVHINLENISNLKKFAEKYRGSVPCSIRLNPHIAAQKNAMKVEWWHKQSKFGISAFQLDEVKNIEKEYGLIIKGIHIHSSSVIMTPEVFLQGANSVFSIAEQFPNIEFIDFGGGIKLDVGDGNQVIDVLELGKSLDTEFTKFCNKLGRKLELWFEPGRFLVGNAGILLTECTILKTNGEIEFAGTNTGLNHLIRPMLYNAYHEIINISNPNAPKKKYTVVGNICEIDNLAADRHIEEIREKDLLAIKSAGAYGYSMASNYNSRMRPAEILVINNEAKLIRKRDTFEDLLRNQVEIEI